MFPEDLDTLNLGLSARFVLVEEVATEQDHVNTTLRSDTEQLVKTVEAVVTSLAVLLRVAKMNVRSDQDLEQIGILILGPSIIILTQCHPLVFLSGFFKI